MSESLTGVTFLAFGNGSPDVFSTFAAMSSHSGSLAVGELMGAAGFITAVVAGSMAIVKPFQVARKSFIRDVGFFTVAAAFSLVFLADGSLRLWECVVMVAFYVFYVVFVVAWHWWLGRRRGIRLKETTARLHHYIPDTQELEMPEDDEDEESRPASERSGLLRAHSGSSIPTLQAPGTPAWKVEEVDEDDEQRDRYLAQLQSNMRISRPGRGERRNTLTPIRPSLIGALEFRAVLSGLERKGTNTQPISLRRYSDDTAQLLAQANSPHAASQPDLVMSSQGVGDTQRLNVGPASRNRAVSVNDAAGLKLDADLLNASVNGSKSALYSPGAIEPHGRHPLTSDILRSALSDGHPPSPQLLISPADEGSQSRNTSPASRQARGNGHLAPPTSYFQRPNYDDEDGAVTPSPLLSPRGGPQTLGVPLLRTPHPDHKGSRLQGAPLYTDSPGSLSPAGSRTPSIRLPSPSMSPETSHDLALQQYEDEDEEMRPYKWWPYKHLPTPQVILSTLFPTLYDWREKGIVDKFLGIVTAPSVFLLTITLPIVESENESDLPNPDPALLTPREGSRSRRGTGVSLPSDTPSMLQQPSSEGPPHPHNLRRNNTDISRRNTAVVNENNLISSPKDWNRWLVFVQIFTAPLFVAFIVFANLEDAPIKTFILMVLSSLLFSLIALAILLVTTSATQKPRYRPLFCFLGFAVAIAWISTIANEVVGVLKAFGVILGISDAILGLTIFAVGNSLGDLVADITVARLGYPVMALSACFGGPMLNILLGIGIGGMYMTISHGTHRHLKHPDKPVVYKPYQIEVSTTLIISGITLLVTLVGLLIVVPLNGWKMDRKVGWGLITLWTLSTIGNVIVEVLGYGGDLS